MQIPIQGFWTTEKNVQDEYYDENDFLQTSQWEMVTEIWTFADFKHWQAWRNGQDVL